MKERRKISVVAIGVLLSFCTAQTNLETLFTQGELGVLEQLVSVAQTNDAEVAQAALQLGIGEGETQFLGRLKEALTVNAGVALQGDMYGQASPDYSISVSLDVLSLIPDADPTQVNVTRLENARTQARLRTVQAFVAYKVALETAESAAHALESAEATFRATQARFEVGEATLTDQLRAQMVVSEAAIALLGANGQVIVGLEALAATVGQPPGEVLAVLGSATLASADAN